MKGPKRIRGPGARNEPDVYETSDVSEDDQANFEAVRPCWGRTRPAPEPIMPRSWLFSVGLLCGGFNVW
uniref:Uncharacterized protein n=1 Tax=Accipiter nisus TaxID=211598 RepID=A0A8B9MSS6_9AVES